MGNYPPASSPGAWPNNRTGRLNKSIRFVATDHDVTIGTNMPYSLFLRTGTKRMARRKMSDNALKEGMQHSRLGRWVEWSR
jgi:phage gpG-like protein